MTPVSPVMPGSSLAPYQRPGIIYVARNRVNGKAYVGKTVSGLAIRKAAHRREAEAGSRCPFHRAIRKWGFETFEFVVLQECVGKSLLLGQLAKQLGPGREQPAQVEMRAVRLGDAQRQAIFLDLLA